MKQDEKALIRQLSDPITQRHAFEVIVKKYGEAIYWKIRRMVLTHEDADDILQNTFLKAWNGIENFQGKSNIYTWIYRIAVNEALDFLRKQKHLSEQNTGNIILSSNLIADRYFNGDEAQALLQEAISTLPEVQRAVFNMRYFDELKYSEISSILNTTEGALKASYHIAVRKISDYVKSKADYND